MDKIHQNLPDSKTSLDPNIVHIETELNEFYAKTNITQYYINFQENPIELTLNFPHGSNFQFSKFNLKWIIKKLSQKLLKRKKLKKNIMMPLPVGMQEQSLQKMINILK